MSSTARSRAVAPAARGHRQGSITPSSNLALLLELALSVPPAARAPADAASLRWQPAAAASPASPHRAAAATRSELSRAVTGRCYPGNRRRSGAHRICAAGHEGPVVIRLLH